MQDPGLGYAAFLVVKFAGYLGLAYWLRRAYPGSRAHPAAVALTRTAIGFVVGMVYIGVMSPATGGGRGPVLSVAGWVGLVPIRMAEWWLVLWIFHDRARAHPRRGWAYAAIGTVLSFLLDIPAALGFAGLGGLSLC